MVDEGGEHGDEGGEQEGEKQAEGGQDGGGGQVDQGEGGEKTYDQKEKTKMRRKLKCFLHQTEFCCFFYPVLTYCFVFFF